jgi:hypothetical protein
MHGEVKAIAFSYLLPSFILSLLFSFLPFAYINNGRKQRGKEESNPSCPNQHLHIMSRKVLLLLALALLALATLAVSGAQAAAGGGGGAKGRGGGHGGLGGAKRRGGGHADAAGGAKHHGLFTEPDPHRLSPDVVLSQRDGDGNVTTITEALKLSEAAVNRRATEYFIIYVKAGTYTEHLNITASKVMLIGDGMGATFITGNRCKQQGYTTEQTATLSKLLPCIHPSHRLLCTIDSLLPTDLSAF